MSPDRQTRGQRFEETFVEHLDAAYDLAHWLTRNRHDAEDVVQEAFLRAFRFFDGFRGGNGRSWLLAIVRNTYYTWLAKNRPRAASVPLDEEMLAAEDGDATAFMQGDGVERLLLQQDSRRVIDAALSRLPEEYREVIVLRELEELSYKEIAAVAGIPVGTVMSRLARARRQLLQYLREAGEEP